MKMSESTANITKALIGFQMECPNIDKNSKGYNYKYADLTETLNTIRPLLSKLGLWVGQNNHHTETHVGVSTVIHHVSGEYMHFDPVMIPLEEAEKGKNIAQETGTDVTYARRYSLCTALNLAMEDTDGVKPTEPTKKQYQSTSNQGSRTQYQNNNKAPLPNAWAQLAEDNLGSAIETSLENKHISTLDVNKERGRFIGLSKEKGLTDKMMRALGYYYFNKKSRAELTAEECSKLITVLKSEQNESILDIIRMAKEMKEAG